MRASPPHIARLISAEGRITAASVEYVDGIGVVKTFGATTGTMLERFDQAMADHADAYRAFVAQNRRGAEVGHVLGSEVAILAVLTACGSALVAAGVLTVSALLPFLVVGIGLPTSIGPVLRGGHGLRMARMAAGHIEALLNRPPLREPERPRRPRGHGIEFDRVSFSYDGVTNALTGVIAVCAPGTITALVGPSGAGKTTLAGLVPPC
ncbi:ABC transporter ATP-binding protein/permease [Spirillospora sp. NBC_00431]